MTVALAESTQAGGTALAAGENALDGEGAVRDARQRRGLPLGDLDRVRRHQELLRVLLTRFSRQSEWSSLLSDPGTLRALLRSVRVDDALSPADAVRWLDEARGLKRGDVSFMTAPVAGFGREGAESVVRLDSTASARLWEHLRQDRLAEHLGEFAAETLPETPR